MGSIKWHMRRERKTAAGQGASEAAGDSVVVWSRAPSSLDDVVATFELTDEVDRNPSFFSASAEGEATFEGFDRHNGHRDAHRALERRLLQIRQRYAPAPPSDEPEDRAPGTGRPS